MEFAVSPGRAGVVGTVRTTERARRPRRVRTSDRQSNFIRSVAYHWRGGL